MALFDWDVDGLVFRLRSVKMEQRKLNDQANSLVDLAKVRQTHSVLLHCTWRRTTDVPDKFPSSLPPFPVCGV